MPSAVEERPALEDALELLHRASRTPAKQRTVKVSSVVDVICRYAFEDGLTTDALRDVVQLTSVKTNLDQTSITTLIKNLYPARRVPVDVIITVVGALGLGKGKPSPGTQDSFVKWLMTVHEIIDSPSILSRLYSVLFGMLDVISIRTSLCHLLSLITRRKHVKPFRIQQILELSRGLGNEPALQGLLRIFKDYYPDIILGSTSTSRKSFAPQPDAEWRTRISAIEDASTAADDTLINRHNGFKVARRGPKRSKTSALPDVHTYHATEASVTLEGIDNVDDFVEKLDRIEPPGQMISFLTDPLLQKYVELKPEPITSTRIDLWLSTCLEDVYEGARLGTGDVQYAEDILAGLLKHAKYTKELHPSVLRFLESYLQIWNGQDHVNSILGLLAHIPITRFHDTYETCIQPAERALLSHGPSTYEPLLAFYTSLLAHQILTATSPGTPSTRQLFHDLTTHVSLLATSLLLTSPSPSLTSHTLSFYELLTSSSIPHTIPIILPPMLLVSHLLHIPSATTFTRTCGVIGAAKRAFDAHPRPVKEFYGPEVTDALNWCLRDIYHALWISRALVATKGKARGLHCDPELRARLGEYLTSLDKEYAIGGALGLTMHAWLAGMCAAAWRGVEEREVAEKGYDRGEVVWHQGPVSLRSLEVLKRKGGVEVEWDGAGGFKVEVLGWLEERGMGGVKGLMFATVTELRGRG